MSVEERADRLRHLLAGFGTGAFIAGTSNGFLGRITSQNRLVVAAIALALGGAGWLITGTGIDVAVQLASPRWVVGRTLSIYYALSAGGSGCRQLDLGFARAELLPDLGFGGRRRGSVAGCSSGNGVADTSMGRNGQVAHRALDLKPRSDPIVAKSEYLISEEIIVAFLASMRAKRHALSRADRELDAPAQPPNAFTLDRKVSGRTIAGPGAEMHPWMFATPVAQIMKQRGGPIDTAEWPVVADTEPRPAGKPGSGAGWQTCRNV